MHGNLISLSQLIIKLRRRLQDFLDDPRRIIPKGVSKIGKSIFGVKPFSKRFPEDTREKKK